MLLLILIDNKPISQKMGYMTVINVLLNVVVTLFYIILRKLMLKILVLVYRTADLVKCHLFIYEFKYLKLEIEYLSGTHP